MSATSNVCVSLMLFACVAAGPAFLANKDKAEDTFFANHTEVKNPLEVGGSEEDPWKAYSQQAKQVDAGVGAFSDVCKTIKDPSWQTAGNSVAAIGKLVAVTVPPPEGLVVGGFMGLVGGLMSIFGHHKPSGPSNQDIMNSMNNGFTNVMNAIDQLGQRISIEIGQLSAQIKEIQMELDQLVTLTDKIYTSTVLQGGRIKTFTQKAEELSRLYNNSQVEPVLLDDYKRYLFKLAEDYADMQDGGALGPANLNAMLGVTKQTFSPEPNRPPLQDYALVSQSVTLYKWFYQARSSLFSALMQASILMHGNLTQEALGFTNAYVRDIHGFDAVLKQYRLGKTVSFDSSHAMACAATANSVMQMQGLSLDNFMNPYIYASRGQCSRPVGLVSPPWDVPPDFNSWPGRKYYNNDATLNMLVDANATECDANLFWNGRSLFRDMDGHTFVNYSAPPAIQLEVEWLKSCPPGIEPWAQSDHGFITDPGCGCRIYAAIEGTAPSLPMCRNTCFA